MSAVLICSTVLNTKQIKIFLTVTKQKLDTYLKVTLKPVYHLVTDRWGISAQQAMENEYLTLHLYKRLAANITTIYSLVLLTKPHAVHRCKKGRCSVLPKMHTRLASSFFFLPSPDSTSKTSSLLEHL
uniref:Uncharacterized protein n=1 Tax=Ixodes ricinus TaxID=34613 RepID=A0A6B0URD4_IXORI